VEKNFKRKIHKDVEAKHFTHGKPPKEFHKINHMNNSQLPLEMKLHKEIHKGGESTTLHP
jgi:hypothetical protein